MQFSELEREVLGFLKDEYLEKGSGPAHNLAPATMHQDVMRKFDLDIRQYREIISRLESCGIVEFNPHAVEASNGFLKIDPMIVEVVRQIGDQRDEVPPNRMDQTRQYFFSKWWFVVIVAVLVVLGAIIPFIENLKKIREWLGV